MTAVRRTAQFFLNRCADEVILLFNSLSFCNLLESMVMRMLRVLFSVTILTCEYLKRKGLLHVYHPSVSLVVICEMSIIGTFI